MTLLSKAAETALLALPHFDPAGPAGEEMRLRPLAHLTRLPGPFLAKVLQRLARRGLLRSQRGRDGGFVLGRPASLITLADIVVAVEGRDSVESVFPRATGPVGDIIEPARQGLITALSGRTLEDLRTAGGRFSDTSST